jgi:hypothetical protein
MSSSTKREVSHDLREIKPIQRRSSRLNRNYLVSHSRKSSTSMETKMPKIVKSSSYTESPSWKHSTVQVKVAIKVVIKLAIRSSKVMKIVRTVTVTIKVNHLLKCHFGVHQTYLQGLKCCLMQ